MSPTRTISSDALHEASQARERLQREGDVPHGVLREEIDASWRRSSATAWIATATTIRRSKAAPASSCCWRTTACCSTPPRPISTTGPAPGHDGLIILANADATILSVEGARDLRHSSLRTSPWAPAGAKRRAAPMRWARRWWKGARRRSTAASTSSNA
jgi:hypothetical protein